MHYDLDEAFALLETAGKPPSLEILGVGMQILRARKGESQDKHFKELARWYQAARQADQNSPYLEMLLGDVREIRGELEKAEEVYRSAARSDPAAHARGDFEQRRYLSTQNRNTENHEADDAQKPSVRLGPVGRGIVSCSRQNEEALLTFRGDLVPTAMKWVHMAFAQAALAIPRRLVHRCTQVDLKRRPVRRRMDALRGRFSSA
jgi:tetratricopeptide (TPR) repeat protein